MKSSVPGIDGAATVILISEAMGARFSQLLVTFAAGGRAAFPANAVETVGYVVTGGATIAIGERKRCCAAGAFFSLPPGWPGS